MNNINKVLCVIATIFLASCASTHNLSDGNSNLLGGGYFVSETEPGKFHIIATTNWAPWPNHSGARSMWEKEAKKACAKKPYSEVDVSERVYDSLPSPFPLVKYLVTEKDGYAVCEISVSDKTNSVSS